jgi:hypothetical protein
MASPHALEFWTIYDHPRDYPDSFVLRRWTLDPGAQPDSEARTGAAPDDLRALIPPGAYDPGRMARDDPVIVEVWIR